MPLFAAAALLPFVPPAAALVAGVLVALAAGNPWLQQTRKLAHFTLGLAVLGLGAAADLGTVEVGKIADLIVVRDNPLDDIHHLRSLLLVLKDGRVVADHRQKARA